MKKKRKKRRVRLDFGRFILEELKSKLGERRWIFTNLKK